jgi:hypothetical protein
MKNLYKYLSVSAVSASLCLFLSFSANAQHHMGGGGGGGSRPAPSAPRASAPAPQRSYTPRQGSVKQTTTRSSGARTQYGGHTGVSGHTGVTAHPYRTYSGSVYGHTHSGGNYGRGVSAYHGGGTLRATGGYHYNHGYYGSYYAPRLGFSVGFLPYGYYPFYFGDYQYFYSGGLYYQYDNDQYTVVEPPVGAEVTTLPSNAQSIVINGQQYYEVNGVYYQPITKDDGTLSYQIAGKDGELNTTDSQGVDNAPPAPQIGDIVDALPANCNKININGDKLYVSPDGVYYKAQMDKDNNKVYKIVGLPADDDNAPADQGGN